MSGRARKTTTRTRLTPLAAAALGALAVPATAIAVINEPPANSNIEVSVTSDIVITDGHPVGAPLTVNVRRGDTIIGTATGTTAADPDDAGNGVFEVNHEAPAGDEDGGACWDGDTPDILAGDTVEVLSAPDTGDAMVVQDVGFTAGPAQTGPGSVEVRGFARDGEDGTPLAADSLAQLIINGADRFTSGRAIEAAPVVDGTGNWTATHGGLPAEDVPRALDPAAEVLIEHLEAEEGEEGEEGEEEPTTGAAATVAEFGAPGGPAIDCGGQFNRSAATNLDRTVVNIANQGQPLVVSGVIAPGLTGAVSVPGGVPQPMTVTGRTWTATIPAAELQAQPDGEVVVSAAFAGDGAPTRPTTLSLTKDTVAPAPPVANPGPGTYERAQRVTLRSPGAQVRYTNNGATPTAASPLADGPIRVTASQTLKARAIDAAGNQSVSRKFAYTIAAPQPEPEPEPEPAPKQEPKPEPKPAPRPQPAPPAPAPQQAVTPAPAPAPVAPSSTPAAKPLALGSLITSGRISRSRARSVGLRLVMRVPEGAEVLKIAVYRETQDGRELVGLGWRAPSDAGLYRTRLRDRKFRRQLTSGRYVIEVTPGASRTDLGNTARYAVRIAR